jgi:glucokinase
MSSQPQFAVGIDLGATKIAAALVTREGEVVAEDRAATAPQSGIDAVVDRIAGLARTLMAQSPKPVMGIGIGTPGYVDPATGIVRTAVNLGWTEVSLVERLHSCLGIPGVWVENDANIQALGEYYFGAARSIDHFVYIGIGSGLGSGILVNGQLVSGDTFTAAELGHLSLDPEGRLCACGLRGCVETVVSGPGILTSARLRLADGEASTLLRNTPELTPEQIVRAARAGDPLAVAVFAETARWLGITLAACVAVLNPARFVIGGGMGHSAFDLLRPGAWSEL